MIQSKSLLLAGPLVAALGSTQGIPPEAPSRPSALPRVRFVDVARDARIDFILENGPTPRRHLI